MFPRPRASLVAAVLSLALLALAGLAPAAGARTAFVRGELAGTLTPFATATDEPVGQPLALPAKEDLGGMAITPDGATLYVANSKADTVLAVDTRTDKPVGQPIAVGDRPEDIAIAPDCATAYVTNVEAGTVSVIATATNQVVGQPIAVTGGAGAIAISPDGATAYVTGGKGISTIDTRTNQAVAGRIDVGASVGAIAIAPDGKFAYVLTANPDGVAVVDLRTNQVVGQPIAVGIQPIALAITPDGGSVYVSNLGSGTVSVIATATNQVVGQPIAVGDSPLGVAISPDGNHVYVAVLKGGRVADIDTRGGLFPGVSAIAGPSRLAITPDRSPSASFTSPATVPVGGTASFDASASSDPDGAVAKYEWSFGDGQSATSASPRLSHVFAAPGSYRVTLQVRDDEGCGAALKFTGQTAFCSGSAAGQVTRTVVVTAAPRVTLPIEIAPDTFIERGPLKRTGKARAAFRFASTQPGSSFQCKLDRRPFRTCRSPLRVVVKRGSHRLLVRAIGPRGAVDPTPARIRWRFVRPQR